MKICWRGNETLIATLLFLLSSCAPLLWQNGYADSVFLGYGDYVSPFNSLEKLYQLFSVYDLLSLGGADQSFNQSFIPYYSIHFILEWLGSSSAVATTLILCGILFSAQYGFFLYIKEKIDPVSQWSAFILAISGSFLYGASPYFISNVFPGHISSLFLICLFPFLIRYFDDYLEGTTYRVPSSVAIKLIICLVLGSAAFANIGNFIAFVLVFGVYTVFKALIEQKRTVEIFTKFFGFVFLMVLINAWWMLTFAIDIGETIQRNEAANTIGASILYATKYSTVSNTFIGLPEAVFHIPGFLDHQYYIGWLYRGLMWTLLAIGITGLLLEKDKSRVFWQVPIVGLLLFAAFITKGPTPPISDIFMFAWDHVPTFQIFRRPGSKIYWAYWFCFVTLGVMGASVCLAWARRYQARTMAALVVSVLVGAALFSVFVLSKTTLLKGITPEENYYSAVQFLKSDGANRILMLPPTVGAPYTMTEALEHYYGVDFFEQMVNSVVLIPENGKNKNTSSFQGKVNVIGEKIVNGKQICSFLQELGITHLVFRSDIEMLDTVEGIYRVSLRNAYLSKDLQFTNEFGPLAIFKVIPKCTSKSITYEYSFSEAKSTIDVAAKSSTSMTFLTPHGIDKLDLVMRSDFSKNWIVDVYEEDVTPFELIIRRVRAVLTYVCHCNHFDKESGPQAIIQHDYYAEYGNQWHIQLPSKTQNYIVSATYIKQYVFYIGLIISIAFAIGIILSGMVHTKKSHSQGSKRNNTG